MSEKQSVSVTEALSDDIFEAYSKKIKEDVSKPKGGSYNRTYEDVAYCGLEAGINKIVRLLGAPPGLPDHKYLPSDPVVFYVSKKLKNQQGHQFDLRLPIHDEIAAKDHIVHRLAAKVTEVDWIKDPSSGKNKKVYKYETKFPELWDAVNHTGYDAKSDPNGYKYSKGLVGSECVVFNVLDRSDTWCRDNKHTKVLVKDLSVLEDGRIFVNSYMPANGFVKVIRDGVPELGILINKYGSYEKYDVSIYRTGQMNPAYKFYNASKLIAAGMADELTNDDGSEVDTSSVGAVGPITVDELTYERYDLQKMFQPSSYQKIEKNIGWVFKLCDATLGTKFYNELEQLVAEEKAHYDEIYRKEETQQSKDESAALKEAINQGYGTDEITSELPAAPRRRTSSSSNAEKFKSLLKGWDSMTDEQKSWIEDVTEQDGKINIKWTAEVSKSLLECECGARAPSDITICCPACGIKFE